MGAKVRVRVLLAAGARFLAAGALGAALAGAAGSARAHHSMTVYEVFSTTLEGTVQEFKFINPHSIIVLRVPGPKGATVWYLEGDPPAALERDGLSRAAFRPGDRLKVNVNRLRSGQNGGLWTVRTIIMQNGHEFSGHQCLSSADRCNSQ